MLLLDRFKFDVAQTLVANSIPIAASDNPFFIALPFIVSIPLNTVGSTFERFRAVHLTIDPDGAVCQLSLQPETTRDVERAAPAVPQRNGALKRLSSGGAGCGVDS